MAIALIVLRWEISDTHTHTHTHEAEKKTLREKKRRFAILATQILPFRLLALHIVYLICVSIDDGLVTARIKKREKNIECEQTKMRRIIKSLAKTTAKKN